METRTDYILGNKVGRNHYDLLITFRTLNFRGWRFDNIITISRYRFPPLAIARLEECLTPGGEIIQTLIH